MITTANNYNRTPEGSNDRSIPLNKKKDLSKGKKDLSKQKALTILSDKPKKQQKTFWQKLLSGFMKELQEVAKHDTGFNSSNLR